MTKPLLDVVAELDLKFKSGNEVRVERAIITREEWMELLRGLEALQSSANSVLNCRSEKFFDDLWAASSKENIICPKCLHLNTVDAFACNNTIICPSCNHDLIGA